jgi:FkbM family methyltransferase
MKVFATFRVVLKECQCSIRLCKDWSSRFRLMSDYLMSHVLFALPSGLLNRERNITTRNGVKLSYRLNRGDLQSIREVWCDEVYSLPFAIPSGALLDLGANIGLTTIWMATRSHFSKIIAVEPDRENAALVAKNLRQNGISGEVVQAAVGPRDGTAYFRKASWSNLGACVGFSSDDKRLDVEGTSVPMVSVGSILKRFELDRLAIVKVDIEGSEQTLLLGPCEWLNCTESLVVEFHPPTVDYELLSETVTSHGFKFIPASPQNMDCFVRC